MMHPTELAAYGRARHEDLLREADRYRLGEAVARTRRDGRRTRPNTGRLVGLAMAALAAGALALQLAPGLARAWTG